MDVPLSSAKRRILDLLKRGGVSEAGGLAEHLGITDVAVRQHLAVMEDHGLVRSAPAPPRGRGRPAIAWSLTELADGLFPDRHADLTVSLISATRHALGEKGMQRVIAHRSDQQLKQYRASLPPPTAPLKRRLDALARQRSAEGYMAEVRRESRGVYLLIEHHCPICEAARTCQGLCAAELDVFRHYLGSDVAIERVDHLLACGDRCAYRVHSARS